MGLLSFLFPASTSPQDAHEALKLRQAVLIDVREPREWKAGHAPGARNLPLSRLGARIGELSPDRSYIVVCRSGSRSRSAAAQLRKAGLDAVNLKGGMHGWQRAGLPLEPRKARIV
jgi:rhodanese-related sulfurtransferase